MQQASVRTACGSGRACISRSRRSHPTIFFDGEDNIQGSRIYTYLDSERKPCTGKTSREPLIVLMRTVLICVSLLPSLESSHVSVVEIVPNLVAPEGSRYSVMTEYFVDSLRPSQFVTDPALGLCVSSRLNFSDPMFVSPRPSL